MMPGTSMIKVEPYKLYQPEGVDISDICISKNYMDVDTNL
jgi:hypothetical protein